MQNCNPNNDAGKSLGYFWFILLTQFGLIWHVSPTLKELNIFHYEIHFLKPLLTLFLIYFEHVSAVIQCENRGWLRSTGVGLLLLSARSCNDSRPKQNPRLYTNSRTDKCQQTLFNGKWLSQRPVRPQKGKKMCCITYIDRQLRLEILQRPFGLSKADDI